MKKLFFGLILFGVLVAIGIKTGVIQIEHPIDA